MVSGAKLTERVNVILVPLTLPEQLCTQIPATIHIVSYQYFQSASQFPIFSFVLFLDFNQNIIFSAVPSIGYIPFLCPFPYMKCTSKSKENDIQFVCGFV